jgi:hypothetical protein
MNFDNKRFITKNELAKHIGVKGAYIHQYCSLGKIHTNDDGFIDTANPINVSWINSYIEKKSLKEPKPTVETVSVKKDEVKHVLKKIDTVQVDAPTEYGLDAQKKKAEIIRIEATTQKVLLETAKLRGENIPTLAVKNLISLFSKSIISAYRDASEQLIMEFAHRKKLNIIEETELRGKLTEIINETHQNAIDMVTNNLETIITTFTKIDQSESETENE